MADADTNLYRPRTLLCDIDGTLTRAPHYKPGLDPTPRVATVALLHEAVKRGLTIVLCTGRPVTAASATQRWLRRHPEIPWDALVMRPVGWPTASYYAMKRAIYDVFVVRRWDVVASLDNQLTAPWPDLGMPEVVLAVQDPAVYLFLGS